VSKDMFIFLNTCTEIRDEAIRVIEFGWSDQSIAIMCWVDFNKSFARI